VSAVAAANSQESIVELARDLFSDVSNFISTKKIDGEKVGKYEKILKMLEERRDYWALNDVGTSLFIKAEALKKAGKVDEAKKVYKELIDKYFYSQCWDPQGWFWKPAEAAQQALDEMG